MAIRVALRHLTHYRYERSVGLSPQVVRLKPAAHCRTTIEAYSLLVGPKPHFINWQQDPFGNYQARVVFPDPVQDFSVQVDLIAQLTTQNPFDFFLEPQVEQYPFEYTADDRKNLTVFLTPTETGEAFAKLVSRIQSQLARPGRRIVDLLVDINTTLHETVRYDIRMEPGVFAPDETLRRGHGSCRDFAWLLVNLLRTLGIAARFVSGYSVQLVADQRPLEGPAGVSADCTDLHAWAEAYLPGAGWIGLDATSGLLCGEGHIPLACTADPVSAAPITGTFEFDSSDGKTAPECDFSVTMSVERIEDRPRPTRSYTTDQWNEILRCGTLVDDILRENDVRLTMGGEPTFVSIDDMDSPEWTTDALGRHKAELADTFLRRLQARFAPNGVLVHGQGKWYPGEPLPRWAYSLYFRKDGAPIVRDPTFISNGSDNGHDVRDAHRLIDKLAQLLDLSTEHIVAAYEDSYYYLWRERRLPCNVDPFDSRLEDPTERSRLQRVFEHGLANEVGYVLPIRVSRSQKGTTLWETGAWVLRSERLYLLPGDSPMGFRLPLDALPWTSSADREIHCPPDPFAVAAPLPHLQTPDQRDTRQDPVQPTSHQSPESSPVVPSKRQIGTALCVEPRKGVLYVFLPPVPTADIYLTLIDKLEHAAESLHLAIRIEGYPPPYHPMLERISVTPDPGVLEVNIHPAQSWSEIVERTTALYEEARQSRLATDKFMLDGRHTGTGGGNHVVLGGATPADSPFLRRPDLLLSLIAFFNNHPCLSYLFSGLFVGPTSQAPRLDEARNDSLYELEIARRVISENGAPMAPWNVDRVLRHLLVDVTGNTHRSEFCIDKLYSPDSVTGRLGLVELRAFEMPPDARMSCAQQLLVRALIAKFWKVPYRRELVRWGTTLHDRFALPHFVAEDLSHCLTELAESGIVLEPNWFAPHWEFRFPRLGKLSVGGIDVELRQAIEPWHVLGEEPGGGGTVRYVDSSVERIQVLVNGIADTRHTVTVAGRPLPLVPTGRSGEFVAAVRYKAWKPPSSLHPTLSVHAPLTFEVFDTWSGRPIGGCTYHVAHPGGRTFETYPKNALEAESRRTARFEPFGGGSSIMKRDVAHRSLEHPLTLDLRL